jgi:MFS family permease
VALFAIICYKALVSVRVGVGIETSLMSHLAYLVTGALRVNYGTYGAGLPLILLWIVRNRPETLILIVASMTTLMIVAYLIYVARRADVSLRQTKWGWYIVIGFVVFGLGYAVFVASGDVWFTSAAVGNRVAIAASVGIAMSYVGLIGWFCRRWLPWRWQAPLFAVLVGLLSLTGLLTNNVLGQFWVAAYEKEMTVLTTMRAVLPRLAPESTLLLDGVCPEIGAAIVSNGPVDLGGAVAVKYGDPDLRANRITPELTVGAEGLTIGTYRRETFYPYDDRLLVFDYPQQGIVRLVDAASAQRYFRGFEGDAECPPGFSWGWNAQ